MKNYNSSLFDRSVHLKEGSNLCLYPFFNLMINADGTYKTCCKIRENITDRGELLNASDHDINQAWHADSVKELQQAFLDNKRPDACTVCWQEEASGIRSMRYDSYSYKIPESYLKQKKNPIRLDIYPSNICNLKCRICSPNYSNRWIDEAAETMDIREEIHMNLTDENMSKIEEWLPEIREIGLFGGEPLFLKECIKIMEYAVEKGYASGIKLLINTNATIYSAKLVSLFKQFKKVLLNFSIDDIGDRFEYQRSGAIWDHAVKNMHKYIDAGGISDHDQIECKMCCTLSAINVYYLPEYLNWVETEFPGIRVFLNLLHGPYSLCMYNLHEDVKHIIANRLKSIPPSTINFDQKQTRTIENIIDFLFTTPIVSSQLFFDEIVRGDIYRKEDFKTTFPEFWQEIKAYQSV